MSRAWPENDSNCLPTYVKGRVLDIRVTRTLEHSMRWHRRRHGQYLHTFIVLIWATRYAAPTKQTSEPSPKKPCTSLPFYVYRHDWVERVVNRIESSEA